MNNKRGLSMVITTLIIILLVLVAIGIIWVVIKNVISDGVEEVSLGKFTIDLKIKNVGVEENNISVNVKRNSGQGILSGIKFVFYEGGNSEVIERNITLEELEEKKFVFLSEEFAQLNIFNIDKISITPILKLGSGKKSLGNTADSYKIKEVQDNGGLGETISSKDYGDLLQVTKLVI